MTIPNFADAIRPETEEPPDDGPLSDVIPFPTLNPVALEGLAGKIVTGVMPYTEAHPAAVLVQLLARFGAAVGRDAHVWADNRAHPARIYPLIVGKTSDGAKGTSNGVVSALFGALNGRCLLFRLRVVSGLSSGEGIIENVRDEVQDTDGKIIDPGVDDQRLLIVEEEFTATLSVMERAGSILPRVIREAWDGNILRTLTRNSPLCSSEHHIVIMGHVTPGELRIRLKEAQLVGGTMHRFLPVASRRTKLRPDGGNIPPELLTEYGSALSDSLDRAESLKRIDRTTEADALWCARYPGLRRARPDGPVASILTRAVPQVLRLSLAYALIDGCQLINECHLAAALALWDYVEQTAGWMFGGEVDTGEVDSLVAYITSAGKVGRTRTGISVEHFGRNRKATEIAAMLGPLVADGRVREVVDRTGPGRPVTRYYA